MVTYVMEASETREQMLTSQSSRNLFQISICMAVHNSFDTRLQDLYNIAADAALKQCWVSVYPAEGVNNIGYEM